MGPEELPLPKAPKELCFNENDFVETNFDVDAFLQTHRGNASLEAMRDDLGMYLKILRSAMIELINKDYLDFVDLSSNLIGLDNAIESLQAPLGQLREEIIQVRQTLDDAILDLSNALENHWRIRARKRSLYSLSRVYKSIAKLSQILSGSSRTEVELREVDVLERAATEFNQLKFNMSKCQADVTSEQTEGFQNLDRLLTRELNKLLLRFIRDGENTSDQLIRCLRLYVTLEKVNDAERLVREQIVLREVDDILTERSLASDPAGLRGIYQRLLDIPCAQLKRLLEITRHSVAGFDFLVNSFFVEVEDRIDLRLKSIFAPGNPDLFHRNYIETLDFLARIADLCDDPSYLKSHPQYRTFLCRWNLPVYFQIRFQEIAGGLESGLCDNVVSSAELLESPGSPDSLSLRATRVVWQSLEKCWSEGVFLPQLFYRFWKMNLQICSRFHVWILELLKSGVFEEGVDRLDFLVHLYSDVEKLLEKLLPRLFRDSILEKSPLPSGEGRLLLERTLKESQRALAESIPRISDEIVAGMLSRSSGHLRQVSDIPRLFRRTNREVPSRACSYVGNALEFPREFYAKYRNVVPEASRQWLEETLASLTRQYLSSVTDVLTSVQKTEESLRRLKQIRDKSSGHVVPEGKGVSDDDKIRIQLRVDVHGFLEMIEQLEIPTSRIPHVKDLLQAVEASVAKK